MTPKWDGTERRREERRRSSETCAEHCIIQEQTKESRATVCAKIAALQQEVDKMVPWKIFAFLFTFSVLVAGAGFGYFGQQIGRMSDKTDTGFKMVAESISGIKADQAVMASDIAHNQSMIMREVEIIKQRQDVLRDANIKILQERDKK